MFLKILMLQRIPIFYKTKVHFVDTLSRRTYFWETSVPCGSKNSHNVVQLNPDEDKYYLLTPYPTIMQPLKKFFPKLTFKHTFNFFAIISIFSNSV